VAAFNAANRTESSHFHTLKDPAMIMGWNDHILTLNTGKERPTGSTVIQSSSGSPIELPYVREGRPSSGSENSVDQEVHHRSINEFESGCIRIVALDLNGREYYLARVSINYSHSSNTKWYYVVVCYGKV